MSKFISPNNPKLWEWIRDALDIDPSTCRRIIIDISIDDVVTAYIERFADKKMLELQFVDGKIHVISVDRINDNV